MINEARCPKCGHNNAMFRTSFDEGASVFTCRDCAYAVTVPVNPIYLVGDIDMNALFWECECERDFINRYATCYECPACGVTADGAPDARALDVEAACPSGYMSDYEAQCFWSWMFDEGHHASIEDIAKRWALTVPVVEDWLAANSFSWDGIQWANPDWD